MRNQLLRVGHFHRQHGLQEIDHLSGVRIGCVEKVQPTRVRLNAERVLVRLVLQYHLLEVEQRLPVDRLLADLHHTAPKVLRLRTVAIVAHLIVDRKLDDKHLLQNDIAHHLPVHGQLHLDALRMGLRPNEARIDQLHLPQPLQALQTEAEQFL